MRTRLTLLLTLAATAVAAAPAHAVTIGIADQKNDMWSDARFGDLGVRHARIAVPWDILRDPPKLAEVDTWLRSARAAGVSALVTFDRSRSRPSYNPSPKQFAGEFRRFRKRYPWVRDVATWNEANINKRPEIVARWWLALRRACGSCRVLGADLLDRDNVGTWARRFNRAARRAPKIWGLHNYVDANRFTTKGTRRLLRQVRGKIWLTETGGVVRRQNGSSVKFRGESPEHAAAATRFLFQRLARLSKRIQRVYVYNWNSVQGADSWDSGLIGPDGAARPALDVLRSFLKRR